MALLTGPPMVRLPTAAAPHAIGIRRTADPETSFRHTALVPVLCCCPAILLLVRLLLVLGIHPGLHCRTYAYVALICFPQFRNGISKPEGSRPSFFVSRLAQVPVHSLTLERSGVPPPSWGVDGRVCVLMARLCRGCRTMEPTRTLRLNKPSGSPCLSLSLVLPGGATCRCSFPGHCRRGD